MRDRGAHGVHDAHHQLICRRWINRDEIRRAALTSQPSSKIGRTHLQDAVPLTLGQSSPGYVAQLDGARVHCVRGTSGSA